MSSIDEWGRRRRLEEGARREEREGEMQREWMPTSGGKECGDLLDDLRWFAMYIYRRASSLQTWSGGYEMFAVIHGREHRGGWGRIEYRAA